jgi:hypothetical protein
VAAAAAVEAAAVAKAEAAVPSANLWPEGRGMVGVLRCSPAVIDMSSPAYLTACNRRVDPGNTWLAA